MLVSGSASAQGLTARPPASTWRVALDGGIAGSAFTTMGALSAERSLGRVALGARAGAVGGTSYLSPGSESSRFGEAFASVTRRGRVLSLRGSVGAGVADIDYYSGGEVFCEGPNASTGCSGTDLSVDGPRGYALATVGVDVHLTRTMGIGADLRIAGMPGPANASSVGLGLRLRTP